VKPDDDELDERLKHLHLANARRIWRRLVEQAEKEQWSFRDFLSLLAKEDVVGSGNSGTRIPEILALSLTP
jgi:hypothetical protein